MTEQTQELDLNGEMLVRREKLAALRKKAMRFLIPSAAMRWHRIYISNMMRLMAKP